jgi:hypothetical protein
VDATEYEAFMNSKKKKKVVSKEEFDEFEKWKQEKRGSPKTQRGPPAPLK